LIKLKKNTQYLFFFFVVLILIFIAVVKSKTICDDLDGKIRDGVLFLKESKKPYTGKSLCIWDINNTVWYEGNYKDGLKEGVWTFYNIDSTKKSEINYENGKMNGVRLIYNSNNQIMKRMECKENICKTVNQAID
tara:strand:+ start:1297 stop:1701 length:405 start_codon:yes stop_codon:yes gene_type:complete